MCGICGKLNFDRSDVVAPEGIQRMMDAIYHRGPDDAGSYVAGPVGLGHRRLSIIDLKAGKQPISNEDGTIWIVFNGEIYNFQELRADLLRKSHVLKTNTDTEVIIHLYEEYGKESVGKLRGMFAFCIWDSKKQLLFLARDRVGIKPLYYHMNDRSLIFGSEVKSILQDDSLTPALDYQMLDRLLTYYFLPGDQTLFAGVHRLLPGHLMVVVNGKCKIEEYWDLCSAGTKSSLSFGEAREELVHLLREAVKLHMISDVPVGLLLSGGMDSTTLLELISDEHPGGLSTFTVGFEGENFADERWYARVAAKKFHTTHYEMTFSSQDFVQFFPKYIWHMESPVCEPPAIALYFVSKLASDHVKVLISGEGGDEAFAGYQSYRNLVWFERLKKLGPFFSVLLKAVSNLPSLKKMQRYIPLLNVPLEEYYYSCRCGKSSFFNSEYGRLYSDDFKEMVDKSLSSQPSRDLFKRIEGGDPLTKMLYVDTKTWLPDDLLIKADRITMANSIELRVPLLDHVILEWACKLPSSYKLNWLDTKHILKEAFRRGLPQEIVNRKKTGFPVPYDRWFRAELKGYVRELLLDKKTIERGLFNKREIEKLLEQNVAETTSSADIFSLVAVEWWHRIFIDGGSTVQVAKRRSGRSDQCAGFAGK